MAGILFIGDSRCVGLSSGSASTKNEKGECVARAPAMNVESKKGGNERYFTKSLQLRYILFNKD